jgi:hypothetical protein
VNERDEALKAAENANEYARDCEDSWEAAKIAERERDEALEALRVVERVTQFYDRGPTIFPGSVRDAIVAILAKHEAK